jgi:predicted ABC-type ATPase
MSEPEQEALKYIKENKELFYAKYLDNHTPLEEKVAFFTAGPSGAGKTEFAQKLLDLQSDLVHLDIDKIRDFFQPVGYDGNNSNLFQIPAGRGMQYLFDEIVKQRGLSVLLDSNLSHLQTARENMVKLLKNGYSIEIYYIYNHIEKCFLYTKQRESVTKRVVPEDVFFNSIIKSRETTYKIKQLFETDIVLNVIDKRENKHYENISSDEFKDIIPELITESKDD